SFRKVKSGRTRSTPRCSSRGNARPASITTIEPSHSIAVMFFPTSPRPPRATIRQLSAIRLSLSGMPQAADTHLMRPPRAVLGPLLPGLPSVGVGAWQSSDAPGTTLALFLAAAIVVELFEEADRERSREPVETERFHVAAALQVAAVLLLGPWVGAVVAAVGVVAGAVVRGRALVDVCFRGPPFAVGCAPRRARVPIA